MSSKPTFVCVPGGSCTPRFYQPSASRLSELGYSSMLIDLPTVDAKPAKYDFSEDVKAIRDAVKTLVEEEEKEVIVVAHSYGGVTVSEAVHESFGKRQREDNGRKGGVLRMVFISSFPLPEGAAPGGERGDTSKFLPLQIIDVEVISVGDAKSQFFHDLPDDEASRWATEEVKPQSLGVFWSKTTYAAWRHIPTTYLICTNDRVVPLAAAEGMIAAARQIQPTAFDVVEKVESGHFAMLSKMEETVAVLRRAAGEEI
ncbi:MAG: hypothetical protein MMC33_007550 [Icmadophila ericetorum]|nr:hypothetical protein [Icmadophila ericetorum]